MAEEAAEGEGVVAKSKNVFTKKLGPLPVWGWVGVAVAGLLIYRWRQGQVAASTSSTSPASATSTPSALGYSTGGNSGGYDNAGVDSFLQQLQSQLSSAQANQQSPTMSAQAQNLAFMQQYANPSGPITLDQARLAVTSAYEQFLGRAPNNFPAVEAWANQIVQNQSYLYTLDQIAWSPEGVAYQNTLGTQATSKAPVVSSSQNAPAPVQGTLITSGVSGPMQPLAKAAQTQAR